MVPDLNEIMICILGQNGDLASPVPQGQQAGKHREHNNIVDNILEEREASKIKN